MVATLPTATRGVMDGLKAGPHETTGPERHVHSLVVVPSCSSENSG